MSEMPVTPSETPAPSNNNRNIIIGVVAAVVLCCCCVLASGIGYYVWNNF
ncbi:MAG: hypothetical protein IPG80_20290 [Anaerolineales bacterium]|jgi:hypothetical protein|nr:hypothetical protein [Anaerolineales bacterium]MBK7448741.1 hypothetical protein [Anaerolineales bacterium]MBK9780324.1 hypothetical protein [Anaerolineales bacterium]